ncbi:hypothetical protein CC86DRAFT_457669 [Ophiobolus disseminans]|uniref:Uncharacterized protein n=1 Tax=Ophiobolus disseminans TaxID=1469910 RepID=A0A6A6ZS13_9PLEO|nr:hypothetical protein CC86DRAFT_457669 [Ophiobolus disseminans]
MADPPGLLTSVAVLASTASSFFTTVYDIERAGREAEDLRQVFEEWYDFSDKYEALLDGEHLDSLDMGQLQQQQGTISRICVRTDSMPPQPLFNVQSAVPVQTSFAYARKSQTEYAQDYLTEINARVAQCQRCFGKPHSKFWPVKNLDRHIEQRFQLPEAWQHPSPRVLLASWLILAIAVTTYYTAHKSHRHRKLFLLGSILVAMMIGIAEGSGVATTILTDVPWCLTFGMLADLLVHRIIAYRAGTAALRKPSQFEKGQEIC